MYLDANNPELAEYVYFHDGQYKLLHEDEFYEALIHLCITANDTVLVALYKVFVAGYDRGYHDGY